jgi:hypothetical protein
LRIRLLNPDEFRCQACVGFTHNIDQEMYYLRPHGTSAGGQANSSPTPAMAWTTTSKGSLSNRLRGTTMYLDGNDNRPCLYSVGLPVGATTPLGSSLWSLIYVWSDLHVAADDQLESLNVTVDSFNIQSGTRWCECLGFASPAVSPDRTLHHCRLAHFATAASILGGFEIAQKCEHTFRQSRAGTAGNVTNLYTITNDEP